MHLSTLTHITGGFLHMSQINDISKAKTAALNQLAEVKTQ